MAEGINLALLLACAGFATFGGVMGEVTRRLHLKEIPKFWRTVAEGAASAFVGVLVGLVFGSFGWPPQIITACAGVFGWAGANASMRRLDDYFNKKLGVKPSEKSD